MAGEAKWKVQKDTSAEDSRRPKQNRLDRQVIDSSAFPANREKQRILFLQDDLALQTLINTGDSREWYGSEQGITANYRGISFPYREPRFFVTGVDLLFRSAESGEVAFVPTDKLRPTMFFHRPVQINVLPLRFQEYN
ncbi:MAG: hypothetical protein DMG61_18865 [Acidobacteria bacterium]|nr:MAG: hypothetical protein DMG61_18865 [Acidobacteriota bacterium]